MSKIIPLFRKEPSYEKFLSDREDEEKERAQSYCTHENRLEFDQDEDSIICDKCGKRYTSLQYLIYISTKKLTPQISSTYRLRNDIHFLTEKKQNLENDIKDLKSQKRKLINEIKKISISNEAP